MDTWFYPRYSTAESKIVLDAIQHTKDSLRVFFDRKYSGAGEVVRVIVDERRGKIDRELNKVVDFFVKGHSQQLMDEERIFFFSHAGSALNLYLLYLEEQFEKFSLTELQDKMKLISNILKEKYYEGLETHKYDKFYVKEQEIIPNLIFFSYNINDKEIVGEISAILESKHGYKVFRAHDTIPGGKIWRDTLKENLTRCEGLVAYVTDNFLHSFYAHQECGWVMGRKRPIFPLFLTDKKPGLLEEWQGKPIEGSPDPHYIAELINSTFRKTQ